MLAGAGFGSMRVMVIGSSGQLGSELVNALHSETVVALTHGDIDVTDSGSVHRSFELHKPDIVINTAAFHRVDDCESQVEKAFQVNGFAVRNLALACREFKAALVHLSTDFVFGGERREPYIELDRPDPLNVYGASKLAGEYLLATVLPHHFIIRTCGLFGTGGSRSKGGNFVETMLRRAADGKPIRVVNDQVVTPTYTVDLARKICELIRTDNYGLYHISSNGACSWFEFAQSIFELAGVEADLGPTTTEAIGARARRPPYSVLKNFRLERLGMDDLPCWKDGLKRYLAERQGSV
jgi:dTDP-4-dehydrorhamnose reductase